MAKYANKVLSVILCLSMLLPMTPAVYAADDAAAKVSERSYFDFEATEYQINENDGELKIKIVRHGEGNDEADVAFKAADLLSSCGDDYEILDENGNSLPKVYGKKPSAADFKYVGSDDETDEVSEVPENGAENVKDTEEQPDDSAETSIEETPDSEPVTEPEPETEPEQETEIETETEAEIETETVPESEEQPETELFAAFAAEEETEIGAENETEAEPENEQESDSESEPEQADETEVSDKENDGTDAEISENGIDAGELSEEAGETVCVPKKTSLPDNTEKKLRTTGSSLLDAQAAYLDLEESESNAQTESAIKETLDDMYSYFLSAEGAAGVVHFAKGENEKVITVKIIDNDKPEQNKLFMLAILGTDNDETTIAANATTYITIIDDENADRAQFDLADKGLMLSQDRPEGYITVRRSGGTQYFATVYVSTVTDTADKNSYENFEYKPVAFVPGETEKQVKVKATNFDKSGKFGVRLETETTADVGKYYISVKIAAKDQDVSDSADLLSENENAELYSNITLGSPTYNYDISFPGGWTTDVNGDGKAWSNNGYLYVKQYDKNCHSMFVTSIKQNLVGATGIEFSSYVTNVSRGFNSRYTSYDTYFETDSDQTFSGSLDSIHIRGNSTWQERTLSLGNSGDSAYIKFSTRPTSGGYDNPQAQIDWIRFRYARYTFNPQKSAEMFNREVYDFTQGAPNVYHTYYDGEQNRNYNPGGIVINRYSDEIVDGFYGNNGNSVTISAADEAGNRAKGIYLKGVYFASNNMTDHTLYLDGKYTNKNVYYMAARNGKVSFTPDTIFIKTLRDKGVIGNVHSDQTIKVYPVFAREMVQLNFENSDRDDFRTSTMGKFDKSNKASYIINVLEAYDKGTVKKGFHENWLDYYYIKVPKYSIVRVQTQPISSRTANGVYWWSFDGKRNGTTYYKTGDKIASSTVPSGEIIKTPDYTKADITVTENMCIKPATGKQTFELGYFPTEKDSVPAEYKGNLTNAVVPSEALTSEEPINGTDKNGNYKVKNPYIGMSWSFTAIAPVGYYTQWVNMTGDENNDGYISPSEAVKIRNRSSMPDEVYGNKLSGKLDQDNFKLDYYFLPKTSSGSGKKTGTVVRAPENFYQLANHIKSNCEDIPIAAANVDIGGFTGLTDIDGRYSIACRDLPSAGNVSTTVTADGYSYYAVSKLQRDTYIRLDALSKFNAVKLDAYFSNTQNAIADDFITVNDDTLTIEATVSSDTSIVPTDAHFYIYDNEGNEKFDLEGLEGYTKKIVRNGNELTATLSFNPNNGDIQFGYKVYAKFADQNGEWSNVIDLGYYFSTKLNLAEFIFPLIGSSSLEDAIIGDGLVQDVIGNPLGDIDLGGINGFKENSYTYTPSGIDKNLEQQFTWLKTDYSFGWSHKFYRVNNSTGAEKDDAKLKDYLKQIYDGKSKGAEPPKPGKYATKSRFKWSVTPSVGFNLTLSSRKDGKYYFEDLVFYAKVDFSVSASQIIQLPIGISIIIKGELGGNVAGIYHMYVDYNDSYETEDAVEYTAEDFGMFKKFNNAVRREGYIFLDPYVKFGFGVGYGVVFVTGNAAFKFDMDFQFTEIGTNAYGDVTIELGWGIQLFNFEVYNKTLKDWTIKMFNTKGTDGHIEFDYGENASLMSIGDCFTPDGDEELVLDRPVPRKEGDGEWHGENADASLMSIDASSGTTEQTLMEGIPENSCIKLAELDNGNMLAVFIFDSGDRSELNKRELFYTIYNSDRSSWSLPKSVDDDGTLDDYPNLFDLGDGRILITWSSADIELENGDTVVDALKHTNIKAAFFDKETLEVGKAMQITKTTEGDYAADTMANAAYDKDSGKLILFYTKTEFTDLDKVSDMSKAESANAYMFYDDATGKWSSADDYTAEEISRIENRAKAACEGKGYTDEEIDEIVKAAVEKYKDDWYGQRFLDTRIDSSAVLPRVIDTTSISYNGLALFAWTLDWDGNLDTLADRDIFIQIYNFEDNEFHYITRVTPESAAYTTPKFARSDNATYLFYGETAPESGTGTETELAEHGTIKYLDVTDLIKNEKYTKVTEGDTSYYVFEYSREEYMFDENGGSTSEEPAEKLVTETIRPEALTAAECDNPMDYDVTVSADGQMYLFWTDTVDGSRQIMTAMYNGSDAIDDGADDNDPDADLSAKFWSEPVMLTASAEDTQYSGIGATAVNGKLYALGAKGSYTDTSISSFVFLTHTPFSKLKVTGVEILDENPMPGSSVTLRATVKNEGLKTYEDPTAVTFTVNGEDHAVSEIQKPIPGGTSIKTECSVTLPDDISDVEFSAFIDENDAAKATLEHQSILKLNNNSVIRTSADGYTPERILYSAVLENSGNAAANGITVSAYLGEDVIASTDIETLDANAYANIEFELKVPDSAYTIGEDGVGKADINIKAVLNGETADEYDGIINKQFSKAAIDALSKVTDVKFDNNAKKSMKVNQKADVQPEITGDDGKLMVMWLSSSNADVAGINYDNMIVANGKGSAKITGIVVPCEEKIDFINGEAQRTDWRDLIPSYLLRTVELDVSVSANTGTNTGNNGSGSVIGGGSTSGDKDNTQYTLTFDAGNGDKPIIITVSKNASVSNLPYPEKDGYVFGGWYSDRAFNVPFTAGTKVNSDMKLYARWDENKGGTTSGLPFTDVSQNDWFYDAVKYVYSGKLFSGVSDTEFAPNSPLTRAMLVTVLWRAEGKPYVNYAVSFDDTDENAYYFEALRWAASEKIVEGISDTEFAPDANITREQIAAIMFRYAKFKNIVSDGEQAENLDYIDKNQISGWAAEAVSFCKQLGIMTGDDTNSFNPKNSATRAETAAITQRFSEKLNNN